MAGMLIKRNIICDKIDKRNRELLNLKEAIRKTMDALKMTETDMLEGEAWDSVRHFIDEVLEPIMIYFTCYIDAQIEENRKYKQQAAIMPNSVMDEDHLHSLIRDCEEAIRTAKKYIPPRLSKISHLKAKIAIYNAQLSAMYAFVSITAPLL